MNNMKPDNLATTDVVFIYSDMFIYSGHRNKNHHEGLKTVMRDLIKNCYRLTINLTTKLSGVFV